MAMMNNDRHNAKAKVILLFSSFSPQVSDPVAAEFSLNTQMFLLSKKELWVSDGSVGFGEGADEAFTEGNESLAHSACYER